MASESTSEDVEGSAFQVLEGVVYYVDPTTSSNALNAFVGSKERVRIGKALLLGSVCKALGRTCRPLGGSSKMRPQVRHPYKTMPLRKIQRHDQQYDDSSDVSDDSEQVQEYDTDSDISEHLSDDEDVPTFLRGIQTSSGRMARVVRPLMWKVYCVVCVAAMSLPYETFDNTGKDNALARTHNTRELQVHVMKCNQFCLCRLRHTLVN